VFKKKVKDFQYWLFDTIARGYQWFYPSQLKTYRKLLKKFGSHLELPPNARILDIGCGTGAFGNAFKEQGYNAFGIDFSPQMVKLSIRNNLPAKKSNILKGLSYPSKSFDLVIAANVIHGFRSQDRIKLYKEAARVSKGPVLFHDYNAIRHPVISLIEWIEHGDYFNFIKAIPEEFNLVFEKVKIIKLDSGSSSWYLCRF
jgi:SAM-dependent methyltransferase